ncbi:hypothetical protein BH09BAC5_BH09BAC5_13340 [soil metagenome]
MIEIKNVNFRSRNYFEITGELLTAFSAENIRQILVTPGYLELIHPFCKRNEDAALDKKGLEDEMDFYLKTGVKITKNQFGNHKKYSP